MKTLFATLLRLVRSNSASSSAIAKPAPMPEKPLPLPPLERALSTKGLELLKVSEGLRLKAYKDAVGVLTIGYGHTGKDVTPGKVIDEAKAEALLLADVEWAENAVRTKVTVPLTMGQFDALVDFVFNLGAGAFAKSTLLKKLNAGDYAGAAAEFPRWDKAGGKVLPGLTTRRLAEQRMFIND
jgi:lysozyme